MKVAAIFLVGTSMGGAATAIREILIWESAVEVHLLYGQLGAPGTRDPKEFAEEIRAVASAAPVSWGEFRMVHSFDLALAYGEIRAFIAEIARRQYDRVYVGATGATNPIVASLFQAAMAYLRAEVVPVYVQKYEDQEKTFAGLEIRNIVVAEEALATARSGQIRVAARLAERLPTVGEWEFLRASLTALSNWDDFDYEQASQRLEHLARKCTEYGENNLLRSVSETIRRIGPNARPMNKFTSQLRDPESFDARATAPGWTESVAKNGVLLVADALANAKRRMQEHRYTDSVLRSYRVAECAAQMRLFKLKIHPSRPTACRTAFKRYASLEVSGDRPLALEQSLKFLQSTGQFELTPIEKAVRGLQKVRNDTYLEHGYVKVPPDQSERCFKWSLSICEALLGSDTAEKWREFEMRFWPVLLRA